MQTKIITRAKAEAMLASGKFDESFISHPNYHVRLKAWRKMGRPLYGTPTEQETFLKSLRTTRDKEFRLVQPGQKFRARDPRRPEVFEVVRVNGDKALCRTLSSGLSRMIAVVRLYGQKRKIAYEPVFS